MAVSTSLIRTFIRKLFRDADANSTTVGELINALEDSLIGTHNASAAGKILTGSTTPDGVSATWQVISAGESVNKQAELLERVRTIIGVETDVDVVLGTIPVIRQHGYDFREVGR